MKRSLRIGLLLLLLLLLLAAACGADDAPTRPAPVSSILFIGNSITLHAPKAAIGWNGSWGMAASDAEKDYAHLLSARFSAAQHAEVNVSAFETAYRSYDLSALDTYLQTHPGLIVVELGDNVQDVSGFGPYYAALIDYIAKRTSSVVLCTSTWWKVDEINTAIRAGCARPNAHYVDISGIRTDPLFRASFERPFANSGVGDHPGDRGMEQIANALYVATDSVLTRLSRNSDIRHVDDGRSSLGHRNVDPSRP